MMWRRARRADHGGEREVVEKHIVEAGEDIAKLKEHCAEVDERIEEADGCITEVEECIVEVGRHTVEAGKASWGQRKHIRRDRTTLQRGGA